MVQIEERSEQLLFRGGNLILIPKLWRSASTTADSFAVYLRWDVFFFSWLLCLTLSPVMNWCPNQSDFLLHAHYSRDRLQANQLLLSEWMNEWIDI